MVATIVNILQDITTYGLEKIGLYYSQYRGWVVEVDETYGRLKVSVPEVYGDQVPNIWAWPKSQYSGLNYGAQCLPQKQDLIWVTFEKGNPRKPLWDFGHFIKGQLPSDLKGKDKFWFRTPSGLTILIDDKEGTIAVFKKDGTIEPMVLGTHWKDQMEALVKLLKEGKINTNLGPQGFLPPTQLALDDFKNKLPDSLSKVNKLS